MYIKWNGPIDFNSINSDECPKTSTPRTPRTPKARKLLPFDVKHDLTPDSKSPGLPRTKCRKVVQGWNLYF